MLDMILASDHTWLLNPSETRESGIEDPCAIKTKLGWVVRGPTESVMQISQVSILMNALGSLGLRLTKNSGSSARLIHSELRE